MLRGSALLLIVLNVDKSLIIFATNRFVSVHEVAVSMEWKKACDLIELVTEIRHIQYFRAYYYYATWKRHAVDCSQSR
jgi:hypothetical protein